MSIVKKYVHVDSASITRVTEARRKSGMLPVPIGTNTTESVMI